MWSTYLETFCSTQSQPELNKEYLARILSCQTTGELTPYKAINAVPPAHVVAIREGEITVRPHWNWIADSQIVYKTDVEYDEHFLYLFGRAVKRRTGSGARILAELSGGMDSSSIVCMADHLAGAKRDSGDRLDTISYYDNTERDWDDGRYFQAVEKYRNKDGIHVDLSTGAPKYEPLVLSDRNYPYFCGDSSSFDLASQFEKAVGAGGYRAILSGIGGDELLGGVPTGLPELADYLISGRLPSLVVSANNWCMANRQPLIQMLYQAMLFTSSLYLPRKTDSEALPPWLNPDLRPACLLQDIANPSMLTSLSRRASALSNGRTWWSIVEGLNQRHPDILGCYEYRYPYLDRDLVEFLHRVPREKLVRPGHRRALMRRALTGIVPAEILNRRRKAYVSRRPIASLQDARSRIERILIHPELSKHSLVDAVLLRDAFSRQLSGDLTWFGQITAAINVELWLRGSVAHAVDLPTFAATTRSNDGICPPRRGQQASEQETQDLGVPCAEI
jgi:asparagine synthase (glutamine-hydrolysing)